MKVRLKYIYWAYIPDTILSTDDILLDLALWQFFCNRHVSNYNMNWLVMSPRKTGFKTDIIKANTVNFTLNFPLFISSRIIFWRIIGLFHLNQDNKNTNTHTHTHMKASVNRNSKVKILWSLNIYANIYLLLEIFQVSHLSAD